MEEKKKPNEQDHSEPSIRDEHAEKDKEKSGVLSNEKKEDPKACLGFLHRM